MARGYLLTFACLAACNIVQAAGSITLSSLGQKLLYHASQERRPLPLLAPHLLIDEHLSGSGPQVTAQWSASLKYTGNDMGQYFDNGTGYLFYDRPAQMQRLGHKAHSDLYRPNGSFEEDDLYKNVSGAAYNLTWNGLGDDGVCQPFFGSTFSDFFAWLKFATVVGEKVLDDRSCKIWQLDTNDTIFSVCLADDGVPREYVEGRKGTGKFSGRSEYLLFNVTLGPPGEDAFRSSKACATNYPTKPCDSEAVVTLDVYRIAGPAEPEDLGNRDTGDVLGDVSFVCTQGSGLEYLSKVITRWSVKVSASFGQYALCNYNGTANVCFGTPAQLNRVGRRGSQLQSLGPLQGQCSANEDVGSQYSFSAEARCKDGQEPSESSGCAWSDAKPVRTINAKCVMEDRGLLDACKKEFGHAPFKESARIFQAAFDSSDESLGGCPDASRAAAVLV